MESLRTNRVRLFRVFGIEVYLHALFLLFAAFQLWDGFDKGYPGWTLTWLACLWASVLLHEFGHCYGARSQGGDATEVILWPLGGLAYVDAPMTPWSQFVMTACGPLVNLVLGGLGIFFGWLIWHLDPLQLLLGREWHNGTVQMFVNVNVWLFAFNMIPAYPMDAGRILQVGLWPRLGFQRATRVAIYTSFVCAGAMAVAGLLGVGSGMMLAVALFAFLEAYKTLRLLQAGYFAELDEPWRQTFYIREEKPRQPGPIARWMARRKEAAEKARVAADEARALKLDDVLRRVAEVGMDGLTGEEKSFLEVESARLRSKKPNV